MAFAGQYSPPGRDTLLTNGAAYVYPPFFKVSTYILIYVDNRL